MRAGQVKRLSVRLVAIAAGELDEDGEDSGVESEVEGVKGVRLRLPK